MDRDASLSLAVVSNNPALGNPGGAHVAYDLRNLLATVGLHLETLQRLSVRVGPGPRMGRMPC